MVWMASNFQSGRGGANSTSVVCRTPIENVTKTWAALIVVLSLRSTATPSSEYFTRSTIELSRVCVSKSMNSAASFSIIVLKPVWKSLRGLGGGGGGEAAKVSGSWRTSLIDVHTVVPTTESCVRGSCYSLRTSMLTRSPQRGQRYSYNWEYTLSATTAFGRAPPRAGLTCFQWRSKKIALESQKN